MSLIETLQQARKARLKRMATKAVVQTERERPSSAIARRHVARSDPAPRYRCDRDYERAWAFEILGVRADIQPSRLKVEDIQRAVARHFGVQRKDIVATRHARAAARPRHVAMYLARELTAKSYPEIGRCFGGRNHSTVLHGVSRIEGLLAHDGELADAVVHIRAALQEE